MRCGIEGFHQVDVAQPALVSTVFLSSYFRIVALAALFATHLRGCSGEAVNVYYNLPYSGRSGHIVVKHIAYSNYICHLKYPTYKDSYQHIPKTLRNRHSKSTKYKKEFSCLQR